MNNISYNGYNFTLPKNYRNNGNLNFFNYGVHGVLFKLFSIKNHKTYIAKIPKSIVKGIKKNDYESYIKDLNQEINSSKKVNDFNKIELKKEYIYFKNKKIPIIIKSFLGNRTLETEIDKFFSYTQDGNIMRKEFKKLLDYLIKNKMVLADLKPPNIMWFKKKWIIIDYSLKNTKYFNNYNDTIKYLYKNFKTRQVKLGYDYIFDSNGKKDSILKNNFSEYKKQFEKFIETYCIENLYKIKFN